MLTIDRVAGAALAVLAVFVLVESRKLPLGTLYNPGPAYMPVVLALGLLGFGVALLTTGGRAPRLAAAGWRDWRHAAAIVGACLLAAVMLERAGYRLTVGLMLVFLLAVVERKGVAAAVAFAAALALGSFFLFDTLLRVPLPRGPFGL